ncbi:extracellular solute-binding protein [Celerinatantimonas sp. YJH-8]|uniref:extracellular solute-binding protein n=1 Tax=Celerinatantimonas sp. YJH-8 TaxID=3228714 RepID=UPI0038C6CF0F
MKTYKSWLALTLTAAFSVSSYASAQTTINALFMSQAAYSKNDIEAMTQDFSKANPDIKVNLEFVPYEALHDKIIAAKGAGANGYDVVLYDVIWPAEFAKFKVLKDVTQRIDPSLQDQIFKGAWTTVQYDHKYWGMPWILDTKYLFYNKKILKEAGIQHPPKTLQELYDQASLIKQKGLVKYPLVWSWSQSEALICDYTTLTSAYQGKFFNNGQPQFATGGALEALTFMKKTLDSGLSNPNSREYLEEDVRKVFSSGDAAFAMNWTYMYNLANDPKQSQIAGEVGVVPMPGDDTQHVAAVNGSMGLGITQASQYPDADWKYISYLTSQKVQEKYAKLSLPIWKSSYDKPAIQQGQEELVEAAKQSIGAMFARPQTAQYPRLSNTLQQQLQLVLQGKQPAEKSMQRADRVISRLH